MKQRILNEGSSVQVAVGGFDAMLTGVLSAQLVAVTAMGTMKQAGVGSRMHVPVTDEGVTLQIQSVAGGAFPPGSRATVLLEPVGLSERILLDGLDVSGLSVCDAISLSLVDGDTRIEVLSASDTPVPAPTRAAQLSTAAALGIKGNRLRSATTADLAIGIDGSASMQTWLDDGGLALVAQLLAGVDLVIGRDDELDFRVISGRSPWRRAQAIKLSEALNHAFDEVGALVEVDLWNSPPASGSSWVVVTDHVPHRLDPNVKLVVVLCGRGAGRVLRGLSADGRVTTLELNLGETGATTVDDAALAQLVAAVLAACGIRSLEGNKP